MLAPWPQVLLVDDEELLVATLARSLTRAGAIARTATSVATARPSLAATDLLVTDLNLGDGLGTDLIATLDADAHPARVIIITSSPADVAHLPVGPGYRVAAILPKPFRVTDLRALIDTTLAATSSNLCAS